MAWEVVTATTLRRDLLQALFEGDIACIRIPEFVSAAVCDLFVKNIELHGFDYYENVEPRIGRIGITQFEHLDSLEAKRAYFKESVTANATRHTLFSSGTDVVLDVIRKVRDAWGHRVGLAIDTQLHEPFFAGLVRMINTALLHCDWAQLQARGWTIDQVDRQLAWNVYLQLPERGGSTVVHHRQWMPADEARKITDSYAYDLSVVVGCESVTIAPTVGELVLFNSRNYHEVRATEGTRPRISISSFIGHVPASDDLVFWS